MTPSKYEYFDSSELRLVRVFCSSLITGGIALFSLQCRLGGYVLSLVQCGVPK